jgi:hypothetical protein
MHNQANVYVRSIKTDDPRKKKGRRSERGKKTIIPPAQAKQR